MTLPSSHPQTLRRPSALQQRSFGPLFALGVFAVALVIGFNTPGWFGPSFLEEDGPVEMATVWLYLLAVPLLLLADVPELKWPDRLALALMMVAFAAREADLHKSMFGMSILKVNFYRSFATPAQMGIALAMLVPVVGSAIWLIARHARRWRVAASRWTAPDITIVTFVVTMIATKCFDRLPETLIDTRLLSEIPALLRHLLLAAEEVLELALPLLAMVAVMQGRRPRAAPATRQDAPR